VRRFLTLINTKLTLIDAYKAGKKIQVRTLDGWVDAGIPFFNNEREYRVKPKIVTKSLYVFKIEDVWQVTDRYYALDEVRLFFSGITNEYEIVLISAKEFEE
jgi:hypothetical protein